MSGTARLEDASVETQAEGSTNQGRVAWQQVGLHRSPFADDRLFYSLPQYQRYLANLQEFCGGDGGLLLITGPLGIGKTSLITAFLEQDTPAQPVCHVLSQPNLDLAELVAQLEEQLELPIGDATTAKDQLQTQIAALAKRQERALLIVDDADGIPRKTLMALLRLANHLRETSHLLPIILLGEARLERRVIEIIEDQSLACQHQLCEVEPLAQQDTRCYVEYRLKQAGLTGNMPFSRAMMTRIFELSGGVPGRINRVAQQALLDANRTTIRPMKETPMYSNDATQLSRWTHLLRAHKVKLISLSLLPILAVSLWQLQPAFMRWTNRMQAMVTIKNTHVPVPRGIPKFAMQSPAAKQPKKAIVNQPTSPSALAKAPTTTTAAATTQQPAHAADQATKTSNPPASATTAETPAVDATTPPTSNVISIKAEKVASPATAPKPATLSRVNRRLMKMNGYTLQLVGTHNQAALGNIVKETPNPKMAITFQTSLKKQDWYVLFYGHYKSIADAAKAMQQLPAPLQQSHPWIRSLASVHQAIQHS